MRVKQGCIVRLVLSALFAMPMMQSGRALADKLGDSAESAANATKLARLHAYIRGSRDLQFDASIIVSSSLLNKVTRASTRFYTQQPNKFRVEASTGQTQYQFFSDGKQITIYSTAGKKYTQFPAQPTVLGSMYKAVTLMNVAGRMIDFFWAIDFGQDLRVKTIPGIKQGNRECAGLQVSRFEETFDFWYDTSGTPQLCKLVSRRTDGAADIVSTATFEWKAKPTFSDELFNFVPPKGSRRVDSFDIAP